MTRPAPLILGLIGLVFLALAVVYWITPGESLPSFLPGFQPGDAAVHVKHALGSLVIAIVLFVIAWFLGARRV
jgi:amino acid permease